MKQYLFFILCFSIWTNVSGNDTLHYRVKTQLLSELNVTYIEATLCQKTFSTKYYLDIDFGQETQFFNNKDKRICDISGQYIEFASRISAINYLVKLGYEIFDHQYMFDGDGNISGQRILLKKIKE
ncbi:MAG: hypothetical protein WAT79_13945 [Saprospiraceae bacterium]